MSVRDWALEKLTEHNNVKLVEPVDRCYIHVKRKEYVPFVTAIISEKCVTPNLIEVISRIGDELCFVANIPSCGIWTGAAISKAQEKYLGWGKFGDLMSAINQEDVRRYQKAEYNFFERGVNQHSKCRKCKRIYDRLYKIFRTGKLPDGTVSLAYEYELTAEHVRSARDKYGEFSVIVKTNPNGNITSSAQEVASKLDIKILKWSEFLSYLHTDQIYG